MSGRDIGGIRKPKITFVECFSTATLKWFSWAKSWFREGVFLLFTFYAFELFMFVRVYLGRIVKLPLIWRHESCNSEINYGCIPCKQLHWKARNCVLSCVRDSRQKKAALCTDSALPMCVLSMGKGLPFPRFFMSGGRCRVLLQKSSVNYLEEYTWKLECEHYDWWCFCV